MKFMDESSVTFQSSVSGPGEFGLRPKFNHVIRGPTVFWNCISTKLWLIGTMSHFILQNEYLHRGRYFGVCMWNVYDLKKYKVALF